MKKCGCKITIDHMPLERYESLKNKEHDAIVLEEEKLVVRTFHIKFCPLHAAAEQLLNAAKFYLERGPELGEGELRLAIDKAEAEKEANENST